MSTSQDFEEEGCIGLKFSEWFYRLGNY